MIVKKKYTKQQADYRKAKFTSRNNCLNCIYFQGDECIIVNGKIDIFYVCKFHNRKRLI